ncbi:mono/diheme cytochrome c family protein [Nitrobacteraceae bacterium AZCC 1564]
MRYVKLAMIGAASAAVVMALTFLAIRSPEIPSIPAGSAQKFDMSLIKRGADLAALGDCNTCHTTEGGKTFAGGRDIPTPFGTINSTNITPDPETGIGNWSEEAFQRAMRTGVDREGNYLYPAFPYDHFTLVSDNDNSALYAYLMTRTPVRAPTRANDLSFPFNIRPLLAAWNMMFLRKGPFTPDPSRDGEWNRGAYLVEGIGHCGACHTPRNWLGAEKTRQAFAGGDAEGWHAFTINAASQAPIPWDADSLNAYLRQGWHGLHGVARGPMGQVVGNLATVSDQDVKAIAVYVASLMKQPSGQQRKDDNLLVASNNTSGTGSKPQSAGSQATAKVESPDDAGAVLYASTCAPCHDAGRPVPYGGINLALSTAVSANDPRNALRVILDGVPATSGTRGPIMPGFSNTLTDQQVISLAQYIRTRFAQKPRWPNVPDPLRKIRTEAEASTSSTTR